MTRRKLHDDGWIAPADGGPTRRTSLVLLAIVAAMSLMWAAYATGGLAAVFTPSHAHRGVQVSERGVVTMGDTRVKAAWRRRGTATFLVASGRREDDGLFAAVGPPAVTLTAHVSRRRWAVTIDARELPYAHPPASATGLPPVQRITAPIDDSRRAEARDARMRDNVARMWWLIVPTIMLLSWLLGLRTWSRQAASFLDLRTPGPGAAVTAAPPATLDPMSVAITFAGTSTVDAGCAFAGHVLDLVERRQLRARRSMPAEPGVRGVRISVDAGDDEFLSDDARLARDVLRDNAPVDDRGNVMLGDEPSSDTQVATSGGHNVEWWLHLVDRVRFARTLDVVDTGRLRLLLLAAFTLLLLSLATWAALVTTWPGRAVVAALVALVAACIVLIGTTRLLDVRRWRRVRRDLRLERAQWLAWRAHMLRTGQATIERRLLPTYVAANALAPDALAPPPDNAVGLAAFSPGVIEQLRRIGDA